jgi:glyoxylase-like metal-dependent hydrolase (beta-lactamase superfamily II)
MDCSGPVLGLLLALIIGPAVAQADLASGAEPVLPGVFLIPGAFAPGQQPDGNSVLLEAPEGLIVVDTGRHVAHTQRILDFAIERQRPIAAIVNTHWHLDHVGGNLRLRERFPAAPVLSGTALQAALTGYLADYRAQLVEALASPAAEAASISAWRAELALIDAGAKLAPTEPVTNSGTRRLAGLPLQVHLTHDAVTATDLWLYDARRRLLIAGDLVTLPVPFLDTACPAHWEAALARLSAVRFQVLVPGHGPPLARPAFERYRRAFTNLLSCAASTRSDADCREAWLTDAGDLLPATEQAFARSLLDYYLHQSLRSPATRVRCG